MGSRWGSCSNGSRSPSGRPGLARNHGCPSVHCQFNAFASPLTHRSCDPTGRTLPVPHTPSAGTPVATSGARVVHSRASGTECHEYTVPSHTRGPWTRTTTDHRGPGRRQNTALRPATVIDEPRPHGARGPPSSTYGLPPLVESASPGQRHGTHVACGSPDPRTHAHTSPTTVTPVPTTMTTTQPSLFQAAGAWQAGPHAAFSRCRPPGPRGRTASAASEPAHSWSS